MRFPLNSPLAPATIKRLALAAVLGLGPAAAMTARAADKPAKDKAAAKEPAVDLPKTGRKCELGKPDADGFIDMFNGKDLAGWEGLEGFWSVKDGVIAAHETKEESKQTFLIFTCAKFSDFEMRYKFKFVTKDGNSGVQFRSFIEDPKTDKVKGYQADCDSTNHYTGIIYDEAGGAGGRGIMSNRGERTHWDDKNERHNEKLAEQVDPAKDIKPPGEWNDCVVVAKGNHVTYSINGKVTTDLTDDSPKAVKDGVIALQCHKGFTMEIEFKDLKIKPLAAPILEK